MRPTVPATLRRTLQRAWPSLLACAFGCGGSDGPVGPPVLLGIDIFDATGAPLMLEPDSGGAFKPISPRVSFVFRFDRLLDPTQIEEIVEGKPVASSEVALIEASGEPGTLTTYIPNGHTKFKLIFPSGPALVVSPQPTLPSGTPIKVSLDKDRVQSKDGAGPFVAAEGVGDTLDFATVPFVATIAAMEAPPEGQPLPGASRLAVSFSNLPGEGIENQISVEVFDRAGAPLPEVESKVAADASDPTRWTVAPAEGSWPSGSRIKVTVDEAAADALGVTLLSETALTFEVAP